ncbi:ArsR/SmtB family transcription factor [Gordonia sp. NPDC003376]
MRTLEHPTTDEITMDAVLAALADPMRRRIVRQLLDGGATQTCSQFALPVSKSTQTYHFRVLREAGIINQHYQGTSIINQLRLADLDERMPGLLDAVMTAG